MPLYTLGSTTPKISPDTGSGGWCSAPQTAEYLVYKRALEMAMDTHGLDITIGVDAVSHMRHYMNNTGNDYLLNMPELMAKSTQLRQQFDQEFAEAKAFSQTLHGGPHAIISSQPGHGYFRKTQDQNLFYAIGGYTYWGQGKLTIGQSIQGVAQYTLDFEFHFYDRYNWDGGKSVTLASIKITDEFMQKFHQQCYAREYNLRGTLKHRIKWQQSATDAASARNPNPFAVLMK